MIALKIITPEGLFYEGSGSEITIPTTSGRIGVRQGHHALISVLKKGSLVCKQDAGRDQAFTIDEGFVEVRPTEVIVLTRSAG